MRSLPAGVLTMVAVLALAAWLGLPVAPALADELEKAGLPVYRNADGFTLAVTEYQATTEADFLKNDPPEYEVELSALLRPAEDMDVLCFQTEMQAASAEGDRGKELLLPSRKRRGADFAAVLPHAEFKDRRGRPIPMVESELKGVELRRPAYEIETMTIAVNAVFVEQRESEAVPAIVADRFVDIGHDTEVKVTAMEVDDKGVMKVSLNVRRAAGARSAVIDSVFALDDDGDAVGGGRWTNELDLFADSYDMELEFPLQGKPTIDKLRVVLATKYAVEPVRFEVEGLFQK